MGDSSVAAGALVPSVPKPDSGADAAQPQHLPLAEEDASASPSSSPEGEGTGEGEAADKELLCPICMALIKDAFLTACGHSFCYMCIVTHLTHKSDCPCCSNYLTKAQLYPNFLLDKDLDGSDMKRITRTRDSRGIKLELGKMLVKRKVNCRKTGDKIRDFISWFLLQQDTSYT